MDFLNTNQWIALVVILGITVSFTEIIKRLLRHWFADICGDSWGPRVISVAIGLAVGMSVWPTGHVIAPVWAGLFIGGTAPILYKGLVALLARKYPGVAAAITGSKKKLRKDPKP